MPLPFDTALTIFWFGVAAVNLSLLRRGSDLFYSFILWFACFPVQEPIVRSALRPKYVHDPSKLWSLTIVALAPYLLAVCVVLGRVWLRSRRRQPNQALQPTAGASGSPCKLHV